MDLSRPIENYPLAILDLETTGLDAVMGDAICEIGILKVKDRKIIDKFHSLVNPQRSMPQEAYEVHKISAADLEKAPLFENIAVKLIDFLSGCVLCAYNVEFDLSFIDQSLKKINHKPLDLASVDILAMARDILTLPRYNLEVVAKSLGIDCGTDLHRALGDASLAYQVFIKLIDMLKGKQIESLDDYVSLYSCNNGIFRAKEDTKIGSLREAIEKNHRLEIKYFSSQKALRNEKILPLRVFEEGKFFYLLYQGETEDPRRLRLRRLLDIQAV